MQNYQKFPKFCPKSSKNESISITFDKSEFTDALSHYINLKHVLQDGEFDKMKTLEHLIKSQPDPDPDLIQMIDEILTKNKQNFDKRATYRVHQCESRCILF